MEMMNDMCLEAVLNFSESYNVTPPLKGNLENWWRDATDQLKDWEVQLYYIAFERGIKNGVLNGEISSMMFKELQRHVLNIENKYQPY
ncbi:hypothetical protein ACOMCU_26405 [Lysinibacillus sp. UGB7]|uniref:hypothetical protein n=1 Tax=Lysinibacillus sp. UGB7 TaxID=3411039 RepID=UPI003B7E9842